MNKSFLAKARQQSSRSAPAAAVPYVALFRGQGCQVQPTSAGVGGLCEVFIRRHSFRSSTVIFRASHKSEKCGTTEGWVVPGLPPAAEETETKADCMQKKMQEGSNLMNRVLKNSASEF